MTEIQTHTVVTAIKSRDMTSTAGCSPSMLRTRLPQAILWKEVVEDDFRPVGSQVLPEDLFSYALTRTIDIMGRIAP